MKWLFLCVVLLFFTIVQGQTIPPGATKVQVTSSLADSLLVTNAVRFLTGQGWVMARADAKRRTLTTNYADLHHENELEETWRIRLLITVRNSVVTFQARLSAQVVEMALENEPVVFKGRDDDVYKTAFRRLAEVARQFAKDVPDGEVRYRTE